MAAARHNNLTGWLLGGRVLLLTNIVRIERLPGAPPPLGTAAAHHVPLRRGEYPRAPLECFSQSCRGEGRTEAGPRGKGKSGKGVGVPLAVRGRAPEGQCGSNRCEGRVVSISPPPAPTRGTADTCRHAAPLPGHITLIQLVPLVLTPLTHTHTHSRTSAAPPAGCVSHTA